jgi:molybdopterin-dependent oxidoreductase alpha subunit
VLHMRGQIDRAFVDTHTAGWEDVVRELERHHLDDLARWAGSTVADLERFAALYAAADRTVLVWSMGITQHSCGTDNVRAIVDLALARGNVGRPGAGLMPIRGHSGVQGGAEMGAYATAFPGGVPITRATAAALSEQWGFDVPATRGRSATELIEAAGGGEIGVLWSSGGNFLETLPDPRAVRRALERVPLRVHVDIVASTQMLVDGEAVLLLPAMTRYEQPGGGTETTTERRIVYSPRIEGPKERPDGPGEARAEWDVMLELARRVDPSRAHLLGCGDAQAIREEIARVVPAYAGIERLHATGDQVQWGGERLCDGWRFPTPDGRARFVPVTPQEAALPPGRFRLSTRRGKQFNSMVWRELDPITGAGRDALFVSAADAGGLGLGEGDEVVVRSEVGEVHARIKLAALRDGNVQMFFPEANPLLDPTRRDPVGLVPDYNAEVTIHPVRA